MDKLLNIIKILLLILFTILNIIIWNKIEFAESGPFFFAVIMGLYVLLFIKDIIKKNKIINNKSYNILSIIVLVIINIILIRSLTDTHFLINNIVLQNKIDSYTKLQYGYVGGYEDNMEWFEFINQNMKYFILMITLLLIYRKINIEKKTN